MGFSQFTKPLSNETLSKLSNGDTKPLINLLKELQREISAKDDLLLRQTEELSALHESVKNYRRDLSESRKKCSSMSNNGDCVGNHEIVSILIV